MMKKITLFLTLLVIGLAGKAQDSTDCLLTVSFTYTETLDLFYFTNTSTDEPPFPYYQWFVDGEVVSLEENPALESDLFADGAWVCLEVFDTASDCHDSLCIYVTAEVDDSTAGISPDQMQGFTLYPNPASSQLSILLNGNESTKQVYIRNSIGEIVRIEQLLDGQNSLTINVVDLSDGFYILTLVDQQESQLIQQKFIKH